MLKYLENAGKFCAILLPAAIVLSTTIMHVLLIGAIVLYWSAGNWREKINFIFANKVAIMFLVFTLLCLIGITYSTGNWHDILLVTRKYDKFFFGVLLFPIFAETRIRNYALNVFIGAIVIMMFFSVLKAYGLVHHIDHYGPIEMFKGHIEFNCLLAFSAYICLLKFNFTKNYRYCWLVLFLFIVYMIFFMSIGRSGYFVFIGLMILFLVQKFNWRGLIVAMLSLTLVISLAFAFSGIFRSRVNEIISDVKTYNHATLTSVGLRINFERHSLQLIMAKPIFGSGTGSFAHEYANVAAHDPMLTVNPHNEYLLILAQFGIVGFLILLAMFAVQIFYSRQLPLELAYLARGIVLTIVIGSFANSWLFDTTEGHLYVIFIALTFAALPMTKRISSDQ